MCCTTPGIEPIGSGASMPSFTNKGRDEIVDRDAGLRPRGDAAQGCDEAAACAARERSQVAILSLEGGHEGVDQTVDGVRVGLGVDA